MKKVLIISAHPDDDVLGCGGLISKYSERVEFRVVFIAEGSSCRYKEDEINTADVQAVIGQRNEYGREALRVLGVENVKFYNLPCGRLDQVPIININKIIEYEINQFKPDTVFTHSENDTNNDHVIVNKSTIIATRPNAQNFVKMVCSYEILSSSEWKYTETFAPNYFETLDEDDLNKKWKALSAYESETKKFPFPRSEEGLKVLAKYRGLQSGVEYAEAFKIIRNIV